MVSGCVHTEVTRLGPPSASLVAHRADIELSAPIYVRVTSAYALFIPIADGVAPAQVVVRLRAAALEIGADDVVNIETSTSCPQGFGVLRQLLGWVTTDARGTAVRYRRPGQGPKMERTSERSERGPKMERTSERSERGPKMERTSERSEREVTVPVLTPAVPQSP